MCEKLPETLKSGYFKGSRLSFVGCPLQVTQKRTRPLFIVLRPGRLQREASQSFSQAKYGNQTFVYLLLFSLHQEQSLNRLKVLMNVPFECIHKFPFFFFNLFVPIHALFVQSVRIKQFLDATSCSSLSKISHQEPSLNSFSITSIPMVCGLVSCQHSHSELFTRQLTVCYAFYNQ